ncbi:MULTISPECIES: hypothetical protein [unclassified Streptomyces]|uniref:hypothetical protein n=1 Tax=unclassified Streptomyces TaxID=2593676 RepID=UPI002E2E276A|nr:hypothetical protein [Streptomyces sp. NBC_00223]
MRRNVSTWPHLAAAAAVLTVLLAATGCEPADGLASSTVSITTDQLATHALKKNDVDVQWLSCNASTAKNEAKVDCLGRTNDQKKITVRGEVTEQWAQTCVRGHLTAVVGGRTVFDVRGLGNCGSRTTSTS